MTTRRPAAGRASRPVRRTAAAALVAVGAVAGAATLMASGDDGGAVGVQVPRTVPATQPSPEPVVTAQAAPAATASSSDLPEVPVVGTAPTSAPPAPPPDGLQVEGLLDVPVRPVGVDPDGSMELPRSGDVAGWYRFGPAPADRAGTVVLASHVDTIDGVGAFAGLVSVEVGGAVVVTDADGARHEYTVDAIERFSKEVVPWESIFTRTGERRLVLVTCGGRWDAEAGHYEDNVVVTAVA